MQGREWIFFLCRNCEYIVMQFIYILGMYFTKLRLFFHSLPHYQNTFSPLCEMLYAGGISWLLKHWDSLCMLCFTLSSANWCPQNASFRQLRRWKSEFANLVW